MACRLKSGLHGRECVLCYTIGVSQAVSEFSVRGTYIFETVEILIPLAASLAVEWLFFLHSKGSGVGRARFGVNDGKRAIPVFV